MMEDEKKLDIIVDENLEADLELNSNISEIPNFEDEDKEENENSEDEVTNNLDDLDTSEQPVKRVLRDDIKWYVIHTYSGYENKVKANIEKIVENRDMYDEIADVIVPMQDVVEVTKSGQKKTVSRKVFPGYVFVKMSMNDETWYVVRNTRGVTSFVGPGSKPVPLTEDEILNMGIENFVDTCDIEIGDVVLVKDGPFAKSSGVVQKVNINKRSIIVNVNFFGRETPVELDFHQVQQLG